MQSTSSTAPEVTVGIDVSKARLDAHIEPTGAARSFDNDKCGRRALRNWARREGAERAALEPTGRFHRQLHQCLDDAGIEVVVVNPCRTRNFARSIGKEAKNDLTDAEVLAVFTRLQFAEASEPEAETLQQLADLVGARRSLVGCLDALRKASREYFEDAANSMHRSLETILKDIAGLDTRIAAQMRSDEGLKRRSAICRCSSCLPAGASGEDPSSGRPMTSAGGVPDPSRPSPAGHGSERSDRKTSRQPFARLWESSRRRSDSTIPSARASHTCPCPMTTPTGQWTNYGADVPVNLEHPGFITATVR